MIKLFNNISDDYDLGWIMGFVDGEGCFSVSVTKPRTTKTGYFRKGQLRPSFSIGQDEREILDKIQLYFDCGKVRGSKGKSEKFETRSLDVLVDKIIPFFKKNPLRTKLKQEAFDKFVVICLRMDKGEHLTTQGFQELEILARTLNKHQKLNTKDVQDEVSDEEE